LPIRFHEFEGRQLVDAYQARQDAVDRVIERFHAYRPEREALAIYHENIVKEHKRAARELRRLSGEEASDDEEDETEYDEPLRDHNVPDPEWWPIHLAGTCSHNAATQRKQSYLHKVSHNSQKSDC